ncbi:hypothetical protein D3Z48_19375, partial [Clostridiaceae bacterium]|nr:hypothetical protein [Clostridiaceae bacterium]
AACALSIAPLLDFVEFRLHKILHQAGIFELWCTLLLLSGVSLIALRPVKRRFPHRYPIAKKSSALLLAAELLLFGYVIQTGNIIYSLTDSPPPLQDVLAPLVPACVAFLSMLPLRRLWNALFPSYPRAKWLRYPLYFLPVLATAVSVLFNIIAQRGFRMFSEGHEVWYLSRLGPASQRCVWAYCILAIPFFAVLAVCICRSPQRKNRGSAATPVVSQPAETKPADSSS